MLTIVMTTVIVVSSYKDPERSKYSTNSLEFAQSDHFDFLVHLNKPLLFFPLGKIERYKTL